MTEKISFHLVFDYRPFFSFAAFSCFSAAAALFFFSGAPRRVRVFRFLSFTILSFLLLGPSLVKTVGIPRKPKLLLVLDGSGTMRSSDRPGGSLSKLEKARKRIIAFRAELDAAYDWKMVSFGDCGESVPGASGRKCLVSDVLSREAFSEAGFRPEYVFLFTDGNSFSGKDFEIPEGIKAFHVVGMGDGEKEKWAFVQPPEYPDFAFTRMPVKINLKAFIRGYEGGRCEFRIKRLADGKQISESPTALCRNLFVSTLTVREILPGRSAYGAQLWINGEKKDERKFSVVYRREKTRIMYLCGRPDFEYSFLRRYLKSHPSVELVSFNILRDAFDVINVPDNELALIPFPVNEIFLKDIGLFDIFILHNFNFSKFNIGDRYVKSLENFVKKGGSVLFIGGDSSFASGGYARNRLLAEMLPVKMKPSPDYQNAFFRLKAAKHPLSRYLSSKGFDFSLFPPMKGINRFAGIKKGAAAFLLAVLPGGSVSPLGVEMPYGKGRSAVLASPSFWTLALKEGINPSLENFYGDFWDSLMNYISGSASMRRAEISLSEKFPGHYEAKIRVLDSSFSPLLSPDGIKISAEAFSGPEREKLAFTFAGDGVFRAAFPASRKGRWKIRADVYEKGRRIAVISESFTSSGSSGSFIPPDYPALKRISSLPGAGYSPFGKWAPSALRPEKNLETEILSAKDLRSSFAFFIIIFITLFADWALSRRSGRI